MSNPNPTYRIKKGQVLNPAGRPKNNFSLTSALKEVLKEKDPVTKQKKYKVLMRKAVQIALDGDSDMIKYLINRFEGMPKGAQIEITNQIITPILGGITKEKLEQIEPKKTD